MIEYLFIKSDHSLVLSLLTPETNYPEPDLSSKYTYAKPTGKAGYADQCLAAIRPGYRHRPHNTVMVCTSVVARGKSVYE